MRSCEYVKLPSPRKTKLLKVRNIRFYKHCTELEHCDPFLHLADCELITFELQKRDTKNDIITQHRSGDHLICPVRIWAKIIPCITSYKTSTLDSPVNFSLHVDATPHHFSRQELLNRPWLVAATLGKETLGFSAIQIGLHSACSGATMAMFFAGVPVFAIMLLCRWSSDAFLRYIWKQVKGFSSGIGTNMIQNEEFFTIPTASKTDPHEPNHWCWN